MVVEVMTVVVVVAVVAAAAALFVSVSCLELRLLEVDLKWNG